MNKNKLVYRATKFFLALLMATILVFSSFMIRAFAADSKTEVLGKIYEFDKDNNYEFSKSENFSQTDDSDNSYGKFFISGEVSNTATKNGIPSYEVGKGGLKLFYNYGDKLLKADEDSWHLTSDKGKKVDDIYLDEKIQSACLILQTSTDGKNWVNKLTITDAFEKGPVRTDPIYGTKDVELINGCYYRLIVAYQLQIRMENRKILFINRDKYDYKKYAELYEFYAYADTKSDKNDLINEKYIIGSKAKVAEFDSYFGEETITKNDPHYGWDLGNFFIKGYTDEVKGPDGNMVFLKNMGDKVSLYFHLNQDINKLNGNDKLSISADRSGSDRYFETPTIDFGRGTLIIRKTDYKNEKSDPIIYTNYLESNTSLDSDTMVQLFEEGDYEIALDYEVTADRLIDKISHYRIFFKFSIRNGNCMVYPFDLSTGSEITNSSITENGFYLDLAKSRYLKINVKREILAESADGLVEDTRFNGPARDGVEYVDEGIYTITVTNEYTGQSTIKKIYVGENEVLKAHMTTGLSVSEINSLKDQGATISEDGTLKMLDIEKISKETNDFKDDREFEAKDEDRINSSNKNINSKKLPLILITLGIFLFSLIIFLVLRKRRIRSDGKQNLEGGREQ